jgi:hypothetical protein
METLKEIGIYLFGGLDEDGFMSNDLWICKTGKRP